jgi:hypothetical protein
LNEDPNQPAHSGLRINRQRIDGTAESELWLLAESWWTETFDPPTFGELAHWAFHIIPRTIGSHFGVRVRRGRVLAQRPGSIAQRSLGLGRFLAAGLQLLAAILATPFVLVALVFLLVAALPPSRVRDWVLKLQLKLSQTLGDSYLLVNGQIQEGSMANRVRHEINWLANHCNVGAVVAHSQGGAVVHKALQLGVPPKLKSLFTFGSGLKKLEQLKYLQSSGHSYQLSAAITWIALLSFVLMVALIALWFVDRAGAAMARSRL